MRQIGLGKLGRAEKLGLGAAVVGLVIGAISGFSQILLYEVFLYDYGAPGAMSILETVGYVGGALLLCGLAALILGRPNRRRMLLGWTHRVGGGRIGCAWINMLGVGLIAAAILGGTLGFEDPTTMIAGAGLAILLVGIVPHVLAGRRP